MSNWILTQKGAVLKSEIYVMFPQYVEAQKKFQVVAVLKTNNTSVVLFENLASYDLAMVVIDKILMEIDSTYKPVTGQTELPPEEEESTPKQEDNLKKTNGKKVKDNKSEVE